MFSSTFHVHLLCRLEGVYLLNTVVDQCTSEVFSQHCEHWVKTLLMILQVLLIIYCQICEIIFCIIVVLL